MKDDIFSEIDADVEAAVTKLVEENGFEVVNESLFALLGQFDWPTVQRISNLARRVATRKVQFEKTDKFRNLAISGRKRRNRRSKMTANERR